jgi:acylphosphatase
MTPALFHPRSSCQSLTYPRRPFRPVNSRFSKLLLPAADHASLSALNTFVQVYYEGHVQGVGFRYTVRQIAKGFDLTGFVRNLADGRVELQAAGNEEEVNAFLEAIDQSELRSHIKKHVRTTLNDPPVFHGFEIRRD